MRLSATRARAARAAVAVGAALLALIMLPRPASDAPPFDPGRVPGSQVVWVTARAGASHAMLELWERNRLREWKQTFAVRARVGGEGISEHAREGSAYTPQGIFPLTEGFGRRPAPAARLPYLDVGSSDTWWWVSDIESPYYNQRFRCAETACPFDTAAGENLGRTGEAYDYALVIDYNRAPVVPAAGSAFFLHVATDGPTAGCVAVSADVMRSLLTTLHPDHQPVIGMYAH